MANILIVEDEKKLALLLRDYLHNDAFTTHIIDRGDLVINALKTQYFDLVLLDLMLPGLDGLTLCKQIRELSDIPIIMQTARVEEIDRLLGLELGADDYMCKPYSPREVVARVKAVLRRANKVNELSEQLCLDESRLLASYQQLQVSLTCVEFQLLKPLVNKPQQIFSRQQLMDNMYDDHRIVNTRTIDSHIKKLRKKLLTISPEHDLIQSVYGAGYRLLLS